MISTPSIRILEVMRYWSTPPLPDKDAASKLINEIHEDVKPRRYVEVGHCPAFKR